MNTAINTWWFHICSTVCKLVQSCSETSGWTSFVAPSFGLTGYLWLGFQPCRPLWIWSRSSIYHYLNPVMASQENRKRWASVLKEDFHLLSVASPYLFLSRFTCKWMPEKTLLKQLWINAFVELSRGLFSIKIVEEFKRHWSSNSTIHLLQGSSIFEIAWNLTELSVCVASSKYNDNLDTGMGISISGVP
jgi:hypothetical protein